MVHERLLITCLSVVVLTCLSTVVHAQQQKESASSIRFKGQQIASESYESVGVFDVDGDEQPDIVSGAFWYEGPDFINRFYVGDVKRHGEYWDDFLTIPLDINGDGRVDYVTGGWFGKALRWRENPGDNVPWKEHLLDETGNVETARGWDVDNDGYIEIVPNNPRRPLKFYKLKRDGNKKPTGQFIKISVAETQGHGLGFGDVNGDGRGDFVVSNGWLEAPRDIANGKWIIHNEFDLGSASVPIIVVDINQDSKNDLIVGHAHGYGLHWYEQTIDDMGKTEWRKHSIDADHSQFHTMEWADLDNDGNNELVTGKRYRAHNGNDPGGKDLIGLYYYQWNGRAFVKHTIAEGPLGVGKGTGIYFSIADLRGSGRKDIIVAGKDGLYVFLNQGNDPVN